MAASGFRFAPGSQWQYGAGHDILGRLIEVRNVLCAMLY
jgi:hypothetical protein